MRGHTLSGKAEKFRKVSEPYLAKGPLPQPVAFPTVLREVPVPPILQLAGLHPLRPVDPTFILHQERSIWGTAFQDLGLGP